MNLIHVQFYHMGFIRDHIAFALQNRLDKVHSLCPLPLVCTFVFPCTAARGNEEVLENCLCQSIQNNNNNACFSETLCTFVIVTKMKLIFCKKVCVVTQQ